jgi:hypothetical protein
LVLFVGVVNHWVALVVFKPNPQTMSANKHRKANLGESLTKVFLLDSTNLVHLDVENNVVPERVMDRVREKIRMGLKVTDRWSIRMTI